MEGKIRNPSVVFSNEKCLGHNITFFPSDWVLYVMHFLCQDVEKKYELEIERLNRKLKWYAENQELLDKDSDLLRKKDADIKELQEKVEFLQTEVR